MSVLTSPPPAFAPDHVARIVQQLYGLSGTLTPLDSERDQNFRLTESGGRSWVVKIANVAEEQEALDFQAALLRHVADRDPTLPLPHLLPTKSGAALGRCASEAGVPHFMRIVAWLPGKPFAMAAHSPAMLASLGDMLGRLTRALQSFGHPGAHRVFDWDLAQAGNSRDRLHFISDPQHRDIVTYFLDRFDTSIAPRLRQCRAQVIHGDANDYNLLVDASAGTGAGASASTSASAGERITGLIDFGDAIHSSLINEVAVTAAYAIMGADAPIDDAAQIVAAFHQANPLQASEIDLLYDLIALRLVISVTMSASRRERIKDNEYLSISEAPAWTLLQRLRAIDPIFATAIFRHACGFEAAPQAREILAWLNQQGPALQSVLDQAPARHIKALVPFGDPNDTIAIASAERRPQDAARLWQEYVTANKPARGEITLGIGPWAEDRPVYTGDAFNSVLASGERRSLHLGLDLFMPAGTAVHAPLAARVVDIYRSDLPLDYGHAILLAHEPQPGLTFFSLWGHLSAKSADTHRIGDSIAAGDVIGWMGDDHENGGWQPHVHLQLLTYRPDRAADVIGAGEGRYRAIWTELFPDPANFAGIPPETFGQLGRSTDQLLTERRTKLIRNLSISYHQPLKIVRGKGAFLIDDRGRAYLDCYNNVAHLGHAHPEIIEILARQAAILNTNTRYLHDNIIAYAEALTATLPASLTVAAFVCSGSEANELALRMARNYRQAEGIIALDWAYHGNTRALIDISPYKYKRKGGRGRPATTGEAMLPDPYRIPADWSPGEVAQRYAASITQAAQQLVAGGHAPAAFIAESLPSSAGQIVLPEGYLAAAYDNARAAGAVVIADEVQIGFGRIGTHMWGFEAGAAVPDIVTMGKPIGNGHPMAAVVTTREIAETFYNGMEYFNTFGGNPVSCAIGRKVLEIIARDRLLANATTLGDYLQAAMRRMMARYDVIGDVRGLGLMLGIELVLDRRTKAPATDLAAKLVERCRDLGVLLGTDGPDDNVLKMRPAMIFTRQEADLLLQTLEQAFSELA